MQDDFSAHRPLVSIIIVNFNGKEHVLACLHSVLAQPYRNHEVIVVDNGSIDDSVAEIRKSFPSVRLIVNDENAGFAEANNQGVRQAAGEFIILLNNDTVVENGWVEGLLGELEDPQVGAVTSKVITGGVPQRFYEMNGTINYLGYNIMRHFRDTGRVFFGGGASLAFRKALAPQPFLPEYFLYHEDVFLSWFLRLKGFDIRMAQASVVRHVGSASTKRHPSAFVTFYQERNRLLNSLLLYSARTLWLLGPWLAMDAIAKIAVSMTGRGKSFVGIVKAYSWVIGHLSWVRMMRQNLQSCRTVPDATILSLMSTKILEGEGRISNLANRLSAWYATMTGLAPHE